MLDVVSVASEWCWLVLDPCVKVMDTSVDVDGSEVDVRSLVLLLLLLLLVLVLENWTFRPSSGVPAIVLSGLVELELVEVTRGCLQEVKAPLVEV